MKKTKVHQRTATQAAPSIPAAKQPTHAYGDTWFPDANTYGEALQLRYESLTALHEDTVERTDQTRKRLDADFDAAKAQADQGDEDATFHLDFLIDDFHALTAQERWSALLHVIGLYHSLERELGSLFRWRLSYLPSSDREKQLRRVHKWKEFGNMAKSLCDVTISQLAGYADVDELRTICNSIKHTGGNVSSDLATLKGWQLGAPIDHAALDLGRLREGAVAFLTALVRASEVGTTRLVGPPP